jgi:hypothetical protein
MTTGSEPECFALILILGSKRTTALRQRPRVDGRRGGSAATAATYCGLSPAFFFKHDEAAVLAELDAGHKRLHEEDAAAARLADMVC